jgi:hypothetical protein
MRYSSLLELFDSRVPYTWEVSTSKRHVAAFQVTDKRYQITFSRDDENLTEFGPGWDVRFELLVESASGQVFDTSVTNTGNAAQVFACVLRVIDEFMIAVKPEYLAFSADEVSRQSLYRRLVSSLLTKYPTYKRVGDLTDNSLFIVSSIPEHTKITDNGF